MKLDYATEKDVKMSSKKKKSSAKSKAAEAGVFNETRSIGQNSGKIDGDLQGYSSSSIHEMSSFTDRDRFPDGSWPKDGYGKVTNLGPQPPFNNFRPGFSSIGPYTRNNEDGECIRMMRNEHYSGYDGSKAGFMNNQAIDRHGSESQMVLMPPRPGFAGASGPGLAHGYGANPPSSFMPHGHTPGLQQTYPSATPMLTQLLRYPNPGEKFPHRQADEYRTSGPPKSWMENMAPGINQNIYPPRPTMPFYEQRLISPMNQAHSSQLSNIQSSPHGSQSQPPSAPGPPGSTGVFGPPPYIQSCNPPAPIQRLEANDKSSSQQHQQRSSSQPRPMSTTSSSLGSPNHLRPISPVSSALPAQGNLADKKSGTASKMSSSGSKAKKCKEEVNSIQDISSCDEGGSDSSSSTEVYSQITPMSTPSTTPLPPQSGGTKPSPPGSDESPSNTPTPTIGSAGMTLSSGVVPGASPLGSSSFTGASSSIPGTSQPLEFSLGSQGGGPTLSGLKGDHMRSTIPCSTYDVVGSKQHSYSQMQAASPMTAFNSPYSNYGPGNYSRTPGAQQLDRPQGGPSQYGGQSQMYGSTGPPNMHTHQPCGNYPYPGLSKVGPGHYVQGHSQTVLSAGMHHPMEMENAVSGGGKGYGIPGGMYGPGKMGGQPVPGSMANANMQGLHYHSAGMGQSNPPHPGQFGKTGYGAPFNAGPGNGVGPPPHHQHMGPYPTPAYGGHAPLASQMHQYSQRPMISPVPQGTGGSSIGDHGSMRPASPAFYRGGPVGYEPEGPGGGSGNNSGRGQWVMNMQGMSGGRVMEAQCGANIPVDMPPVTIPSGGEIQRVRNPAFEPLMAKDRLSASPISFSDYTSAESKSGDMTMVPKHVDQSKIENDLSLASSSDSHGQSLMSPGPIFSKSGDLDLVKKDIGSDSNSLPGQDRSRVDSDKQETLSSPPSTPFNHTASSPGSLERDIGSPSVHSSKSSSNSSVFSKIAEMGTEQDRGIFLERLFSFMSYRGTPITAVPVICKQTVDLYRLYHLVRERGGMVDVTKNKKWREVSTSLNLGASSSAGFTLKRNYAKFLFPFECRYDRGNIDPAPIILSMEMSSKKETKKNSDRSVDMDNCRPPSNQSYSGYPVAGPIPHGMPMSDISSRGLHQGMIGGPSPSPYNGGLSSGAVGGRSGMMSPVGLAKNHSSLSRGSTESLASGQDAISIQDPFHDVSVGPGQYPASHSAMNSQTPMYSGLTEHTSPPSAVVPGPYEHRSSIPQPSAPSMYSSAPNQCMPSSVPGPGGQGNDFGDMCGSSRGRALNETGFGNHSIHVGEYGAGGSGYGTGVTGQVQNVGCPPGGDRFDGLQSGYPGSMPMVKHTSQSESHITNDQNYYCHYGNHLPGAPSQRYKPGYDPHFFGASNQPMVSGYPGPQKIATPGVDSFSQQGHLNEGLMMGHAMGPPHPTVPYHMQKNQAPGVLGGIPKADGVYDYQAAPQVSRPDAVWMQHPFGQHYPPQPYPGSHGMHPNASQVRGPYGMYSRFPVQNIHRYEAEKQRSSSGTHFLLPSRDIVFPAGSVEATRPKLTKKRKLTYRDMGSVDAWRLMMALRSGLITESTWALDVLTILLRDDVTAPCLSLSHMPGLLEVLVEQYRRCLILIFGGDFEELEVSSEMQSMYAVSGHAVESQDDEETKTLPDPKMLAAPGNYTLKTRDGKAVGIESDSDEMLLDRKTWDVFKEFESSAFDWQMGRGDMTLHIITNLLSDGSHEFHKKKYFGMHYKTMKKKCHPLQKEENSTGPESSVDDSSIFHSKDCRGSQSITDDALCKGGHKDSIMSESAEENLSNPTFSGNCRNEDNASDVPVNENDGLIHESTADKAGKTEPKVTMDFDNFENNQFTFTQLELLKRNCSELDEETFRPNDGVYCRLTDSQLEISQRCLCLSNIFRNLSFIPSNDNEICKHNGLMLILGKLLLLHHKHLPRSTTKSRASATSSGSGIDHVASPMEANSLVEEYDDQNLEWWWDTLEGLRENTLVMFANICGQLDLSSFPEEICLPILNGLLHWLVCSSAEALDPFTTSSLSPQRLVLEALCKLCVTDSNIDLVLATPPFSRIVLLITNLARMLSERQQVVREFAVGLLSCLVPGDSSVSRALALHHPSVTLLIEFVEDAEHHAAQVVNTHGPVVLRDNPEIMGTSLDMLCRVATILRHLVDVPENVPLISRHQERLIKLIMSPVLGRSVTAILADVLSSCS